MIDKFDIRNFAQTMREITFYRTRQINRPTDANSFWEAQQEVTKLRSKLERAFNSGVQKAKTAKTDPAELWMFGLAAYKLIAIDGTSIADVIKMSGAKLIAKAQELGFELQEDGESHESFFMFDKLMPEDN
ncbi:MAG: hypothetical protein AAFV93_22060 [Chloroflexota bacterium]